MVNVAAFVGVNVSVLPLTLTLPAPVGELLVIVAL